MAPISKNVKTNVLPHSKAKLDLYRSYLTLYLPILGNAPYVTAINVFDIFCGTGIYEDGQQGSPVIAASCIQENEKKGNTSKPVRLFINDFDQDKVSTVKAWIDKLELKNCQVTPYNLDAAEMFKIVADNINAFPKTERSLVFIDPYGYSKITRDSILNILQNERSEIILFLPVAHMKRFSEDALTALDNKSYANLRRFIMDFLPEESPIKQGKKIDVFDYIEELRKAFSFGGRFYTASHYIERDARNYFSLFFIGSHIYGLEKFIECKWSNSSLGKGFNQKDLQSTLWGDELVEIDRHITMEHLEKLFRQLLDERKELNNKELYEFALKCQYKPSAMSDLLKGWHKDKKLQVFDAKGALIEKPRSFGINRDHHKEKVPHHFTFKKR